MSDPNADFMFEVLRRVSAKILLQNRACNGNSTEHTLNTLTEVTKLYLTQIAQVSKRFAEHAGRTEPNIFDVSQALEDCQVNFEELFIYAEATRELNNGPSNPFRGLNLDLELLNQGVEEEAKSNESSNALQSSEVPKKDSVEKPISGPSAAVDNSLDRSTGKKASIDSSVSLKVGEVVNNELQSSEVLPSNETGLEGTETDEGWESDGSTFLLIEGPDAEFMRNNPFPNIAEQVEVEGLGLDDQNKPVEVEADPEANSFAARLPESLVKFLRQKNRLNKLPAMATSDISKSLEFFEKRRKEMNANPDEKVLSAVADHDAYYKESYKSLKNEASDISKLVTSSPFAKLPFDFVPPSGNSATVGQAIGTFDTPINDLFYKNSLSSTIAHFVNSPPRPLTEEEYSSLQPVPLPSFVPKPPTPPEARPVVPVRIIAKVSSPDSQEQSSKGQYPRIKAIHSSSGPTDYPDISSDEDLMKGRTGRAPSVSTKGKSSSHFSRRATFIDPLITNSKLKNRARKGSSSELPSTTRGSSVSSHHRETTSSARPKDSSNSSRLKVPKVKLHLSNSSNPANIMQLSSTSEESENESRYVRFKDPIAKEYGFLGTEDSLNISASNIKSNESKRTGSRESSSKTDFSIDNPRLGSSLKASEGKVKSILKSKGRGADKAGFNAPRRNSNVPNNESSRDESPARDVATPSTSSIRIKINLKRPSDPQEDDLVDDSPTDNHDSGSQKRERKEKRRRNHDDIDQFNPIHQASDNLVLDKKALPKKLFIKFKNGDQQLTSSSRTPLRQASTQEESSDEIKCICQSPRRDYGDFMIACDKCKIWLHGPCVQITEATAPKYWKCPRCESKSKHKSSSHRSKASRPDAFSPPRPSSSQLPPRAKKSQRSYEDDSESHQRHRIAGGSPSKRHRGKPGAPKSQANHIDSVELSMTSDEGSQ